MPTNTTSLSRYSCHMVSKNGISQRQGGHHEAQKFRTTTLPLRSESRRVSPPNVSISKSGATSALVRLVDRMVLGVGAGVAVTVGSGVGEGGAGVGSGAAVDGSGIVVGVEAGPVVWVGVGLSPPLDCAHERLRQTAISRKMPTGVDLIRLDVSWSGTALILPIWVERRSNRAIRRGGTWARCPCHALPRRCRSRCRRRRRRVRGD